MYLIQCVNAYTAVLAMSQQEQEYKTAYALMTLKRKLQPHVDFFTGEEMKLVEQYSVKDGKGKTVLNERGNFTFQDPEKAEEYARRRTELGMVEVNEDFPILYVPAPKAIRPVHLEALEGFMEFEEAGV